MKDTILKKLCSRKFWLALFGFASAICAVFGYDELSAEQVGVIAAGCSTLIAYIIGEGIADAGGK